MFLNFFKVSYAFVNPSLSFELNREYKESSAQSCFTTLWHVWQFIEENKDFFLISKLIIGLLTAWDI